MEKTYDYLYALVKSKPIPVHVAIIMDGNGRWAKKHKLPRIAGHRRGVEALRDIISTSSELGIKYLTLYAFSTENWKRPKDEVNALMSLLVEFLRKEVAELHRNSVKIYVLGDIGRLPEAARTEVQHAMDLTRANSGLQVNIALNYGSRAEILKAIKSIVQDVTSKRLAFDDITEQTISQYLDTGGIPDPDMLIRTSGEYRISNFLLYQIAYTELVFTDKNVFWPDFTREKYLEAIIEYQGRVRRYGGLDTGEDD
ncbi:MAG TPA: isoprenyl transferase [Candidatus Atribacteria bacterium]|nr:isoprenyl transferase [Candidatus Atribacteria bacterium]HPT79028.1 isoprenyl transferase [Candidatus Atribacteria bacterium]